MPPSEPDHIGNKMALLAFLAGSEADATVAEKPIVARQMQAKQHELLMNHVLPWLPSLPQRCVSMDIRFTSPWLI